MYSCISIRQHTKEEIFVKQIRISLNLALWGRYFFLVRKKIFAREAYISPSWGKFYRAIFIAKRHLSKLFNPIKEYNIRFWTICSSRLKYLMFTAEVFVGQTKEIGNKKAPTIVGAFLYNKEKWLFPLDFIC